MTGAVKGSNHRFRDDTDSKELIPEVRDQDGTTRPIVPLEIVAQE